MDVIKKYEKNLISYDLLYKYRYKDIKEIPCIRSVKLCLNIKKRFDFKIILSDLTALEILSSNKCEILKAKKTITPLKIRKNQPVGCNVILRKNKKNKFLSFLSNKAIEFKYSKTPSPKGFIIKGMISNLLTLPEFENNYKILKNLNSLDFLICTNTKSKYELNFLLNSYKI